MLYLIIILRNNANQLEITVESSYNTLVTISTSWYKIDRYRDGLVLVRRGVSRHVDRKG